jgi:hypothetical protein
LLSMTWKMMQVHHGWCGARLYKYTCLSEAEEK